MEETVEKVKASAWSPILERVTCFGAITWERAPRIARLRDGIGAGRFLHSEWSALLERFVQNGLVEYVALVRVKRLIEAYLQRLADTDPDLFADADDQLAFYLNAYNALAMYQVVLHYPVASLRDVPNAFTRVFPVGRRNLSLTILHVTITRAFGDPRIHASLYPAACGTGPIPATPFLGPQLQTQLDNTMRALLADPMHGARYDDCTNTLWIAAPLYTWGGDFIYPHLMPRAHGVLGGRLQSAKLLDALLPYMPPNLASVMQIRQPVIRLIPFDWTLNEVRQ